MRFEIRHLTRYTYSESVRLGPQLLRLRPQDNGAQKVLSYTCEISPHPAGMSEFIDIHGNRVLSAWFDGDTSSLTLDMHSEVETVRGNPFDYLPAAEVVSLPLSPSTAAPATAPFRARRYGDSPEVAAFVREILEASEGQTLRFLSLLNERIHRSLERTIREAGEPHPPAVTLERGVGACRDLAVLFMDCCRSAGLPARFASGYQKGEGQRDRRFLHAWPEIYVEGGGWRGYDPTHGLAVADEHVLVAAAAEPADAAPVEGRFSRNTAKARLEFDLSIRVCS
jgi:transglutaminase-like putative cysteine protease